MKTKSVNIFQYNGLCNLIKNIQKWFNNDKVNLFYLFDMPEQFRNMRQEKSLLLHWFQSTAESHSEQDAHTLINNIAVAKLVRTSKNAKTKS